MEGYLATSSGDIGGGEKPVYELVVLRRGF